MLFFFSKDFLFFFFKQARVMFLLFFCTVSNEGYLLATIARISNNMLVQKIYQGIIENAIILNNCNCINLRKLQKKKIPYKFLEKGIIKTSVCKNCLI